MDSLTRTEQLERDVWGLKAQIKIMTETYSDRFIQCVADETRQDIEGAANTLLRLAGYK